MNRETLVKNIKAKNSFLCIGLDTDINRIPAHLHKEKDPVFAFNKQIVDATIDYCIAYKPNLAFYEALGPKGLESLAKTMEYIPEEVFTIADAKRGDIGNTAALYAKTFYETYAFDSVTVAPYMGKDSVTPFLEYKDRWVILLALTSNSGSQDFQNLVLKETGDEVYKMVIKKSMTWADAKQLMYVVGATQASKLKEIRAIAPDHFLLIPGVGAQGGNLQQVVANGINSDCGLIVNSSRGIIYAGNDKDFAKAAKQAASKLQQEMRTYLDKI